MQLQRALAWRRGLGVSAKGETALQTVGAEAAQHHEYLHMLHGTLKRVNVVECMLCILHHILEVHGGSESAMGLFPAPHRKAPPGGRSLERTTLPVCT